MLASIRLVLHAVRDAVEGVQVDWLELAYSFLIVVVALLVLVALLRRIC